MMVPAWWVLVTGGAGIIGAIIAALIAAARAFRRGYGKGFHDGGIGICQAEIDTGTVGVTGPNGDLLHVAARHATHQMDSRALACAAAAVALQPSSEIELHGVNHGLPNGLHDPSLVNSLDPAFPDGVWTGLTARATRVVVIGGVTWYAVSVTPSLGGAIELRFSTQQEQLDLVAKINRFWGLSSAQNAVPVLTRLDLVVRSLTQGTPATTRRWVVVRLAMFAPFNVADPCTTTPPVWSPCP
jgi:hypothetical protein